MDRVPKKTSQAVPFLWAAFFLLLTGIAPVRALDLLSLWRYPAAGRITAIYGSRRDKVIYFLCEDRNLYAVSHNGVPLWKSNLGGKPTGLLSEGPDGTVYAVLQNNSLIAVNPRGKVIWEAGNLGKPVTAPLVDRRGIVYHLSREGRLTAFSHTGNLRWEQEFPLPPAGYTLLRRRGICLWFENPAVVVLYSPWGARVWEYPIETASPGTLFSIENVIIALSDSSDAGYGIYSSGEGAWSIGKENTGRRYIDIYQYGESAVLLDSNGDVQFLRKNGNMNDIGNLAGAETITGVESEGYISAAGKRGRFLVLDSSGEEHRFSIPRVASAKPVRVGPGLYAGGGDDWILYLFQLEGEKKQVYRLGRSSYATEETGPDLSGLGGFQYHYLNHLVDSSEEGDKEEALNIIASYLSADDQGNRHNLSLQFLRKLASQGVLDTEYVMGKMHNNFPQVRMRAAGLLSRHGDLETRDFLIRLIRYEHDSLALASEIIALGNLKSDPDGRGGEIINRVIQSDSLVGGSDRLADAAIRAITYISNYHGTIDERSIDTLFLIFKGNYSKENRSRALAALQGVGK